MNRAAKQVPLTLPAGQRLDKFLVNALADTSETISRSRLQRLIAEGHISDADGNPILKASHKAKQDLPLVVHLPAERETKLKPIDLEIPVIFEDKYLAVVHKPAGMTVHPGAGTRDDTLVHALIGKFDKLAPDGQRPGIVHRLDRETEGLMVIAKTVRARAALAEAFAEREVHKTYTALVWGSVTLPEEIDGLIWRDIRDRKRMRFGLAAPASVTRARSALMNIVAAQRHRFATRLEIELITGRTHQIRATCAHFNAPIIGDELYGNDAAKAKLYKVGREKREAIAEAGMLLVAQKLEFKHPFTRRRLKFALPVPERFETVLRLLT